MIGHWSDSLTEASQYIDKFWNFQDIREVTKKPLKMKTSRIWTDEDLEEIRILYNEFKDASDPVNRIMERLQVKRQKKRVVEKIMGEFWKLQVNLQFVKTDLQSNLFSLHQSMILTKSEWQASEVRDLQFESHTSNNFNEVAQSSRKRLVKAKLKIIRYFSCFFLSYRLKIYQRPV